jgi:hypothetical protein
MSRERAPRRRVFATFIAAFIGPGIAAPQAQAHDWYPMECCHATDCAPVDSTTYIVPTGDGIPQMVVTSKHGTAVVSQNFPRQESKDNRMHICMRRMPNGSMRVLCLFMPPAM